MCVDKLNALELMGLRMNGLAIKKFSFFGLDIIIATDKTVTLVMTMTSGSLNLNRVELQNGCLSLGHVNTFILSTIGGNCMDNATDKLDLEKLKRNLNLAIDVYQLRLNYY